MTQTESEILKASNPIDRKAAWNEAAKHHTEKSDSFFRAYYQELNRLNHIFST